MVYKRFICMRIHILVYISLYSYRSAKRQVTHEDDIRKPK